jgi:hypothetical protein
MAGAPVVEWPLKARHGRSVAVWKQAGRPGCEDLCAMDESLEQSKSALHFSSVEESVLEETSAEYLGRWNYLVSTTNWEKGRIVSQWRQALLEAGAPVQAYSDEAWSRRAGNVTPQHVGRLRRVYEQFGETYTQYTGLYWSHFQAVLDWHDAEMWLEGAVQNGWSVSRMRAARCEAMGVPAEQAEVDEIAAQEIDEDAPGEDSIPGTINQSVREVQDTDEKSAEDEESDDESAPFDDAAEAAEVPMAVAPVRPFENLPALPPDLADAFEAFKLAILHHKVAGWTEVACGEIVAVLDALKQLTLAPAEA